MLRRLAGLAVMVAVVSFVVSNYGPALAATSLGGYARELDAAQSGRAGEADLISADLARQWDQLSSQARGVVRHLESALQGAATWRSTAP